jgi:hypothetical protein
MHLRTSILTACIVGVAAACGASTPTAPSESARSAPAPRFDTGGMYGSGNLVDPRLGNGAGNPVAADSSEATVASISGGMYGSGN